MITRLAQMTHRDEEGTALTEMAIVLPAFIILILWSIFFADIGVVKLKALEASRMALWETTVYRQPAEIEKEVKDRFADLNSTDTNSGSKGAPGFYALKVKSVDVTVNNQVKTEYTGSDQKKGSSSDSGIGAIISKIGNAVNAGASDFFKYAKLNTKSTATSSVTITVTNTIFPSKSTKVLNTRIATKNAHDPFAITAKGRLVYDSWKAWPHKGATVGPTDPEVDVATTYPTAEKVTDAHAKHLVFFGILTNKYVSKVTDIVSKVTGWFHLPDPIATDYFTPGKKGTNGDGPLAMLPAAKIGTSWAPDSNDAWKPYRVGQDGFDSYVKSGHGFNNPAANIDRARPTIPYKVASCMWGVGPAAGGGIMGNISKDLGPGADPGIGGYKHQELKNSEALNDYYRTYQCRGHYYDGMITDAGVPGDKGDYDSKCNKKGSGGDLKGAGSNLLGNGSVFPKPNVPSGIAGGINLF